MKGEIYGFIAVTSYVKNPKAVWGGTNEVGFSIINTLSYNLNEKNGPKGNKNGSIICRALGICRTVDDFKQFLDTIPRPIIASANFGVIDAEGHAGYFETGYNGYTFYDADDPDVAPHGYIVRSNFSVSGRVDEGGGYLRYQQAEISLFKAAGTRQVTPQWIFSDLSRSFENPLLGLNLRGGMFNKPDANGWAAEQDFIARKSSSCAIVIQGVRPGENPAHTIMWTSIGYPPVTPFIPLWVSGAKTKLPRIIFTKTEKGAISPLCDMASKLRNRIYCFKRGDYVENYFYWELLYNKSRNGYMQQIETLEKNLFNGIYKQIPSFYDSQSPNVKTIHKLYDEIDSEITNYMETNLNL